jgi:nicotinate-nucleotide adenylyltransferase
MGRIGMLGGTFDPPHNAHLAMAERAMRDCALERVLFLPAPDPPHKHPASSYATRAAMVQLAVDGKPGMELSRLEELRAGPSYTVDLLERYRSAHPDDEIYFIMGSDSLRDLASWRRPERIRELATLVVFSRPGAEAAPTAGSGAPGIILAGPMTDISSREIRRMVRAGQSIRSCVPEAVCNFILDNALYS